LPLILLLTLRCRDRVNMGKLEYAPPIMFFTDRTHYYVGNAKIAGMSTELHLTALKYNIAAGVFFVCQYRHFVQWNC